MRRAQRILPVWLILFLTGAFAPEARAEDLTKLRIYAGDYPLAFFFRASEQGGVTSPTAYEQWDESFSRLMGIMGKALGEEVPNRYPANVEFFTRFKKAHPGQIVLLHYNGNARDPRFQTEKYFAGHWSYFEGAKILADVPAQEGETDIRVSDASRFQVNMGRYRKSNDDVGLCALDASGKPDWREGEQVQIVSIDTRKGVIRVKRGCYGTKPRAFSAGKACAAAHATEGPWGAKSNLLWFYNYSTRCPRDANGKRCLDIHLDELASRFEKGGELEAFDGLEFDVFHYDCGAGGRGPDCDADGKADRGVFDGVNEYGIGVTEFCRGLRQRLGDGRIIQADGASPKAQRSFGLLNGIESEGWPTLGDPEIKDWSGGLNRHAFWIQNGRPPVFTYINHKFNAPGAEPGKERRLQVPFSTDRLVFAAGMFTDSAICYSNPPAKDPDGQLGIWDELRMGAENRIGWLGKPLGLAVHLAARQKDVLDGCAAPVRQELLSRLKSPNATFSIENGSLKISPIHAAVSAKSEGLRFTLRDVPCVGPDLFVSLNARAVPMKAYPKEVGRLAYVGVSGGGAVLTRPDMPETGICLREGSETPIEEGSGAAVRWMKQSQTKGEAHDAYQVHPPYQDGKRGYAFWLREVDVPAGATLKFFLGMGEKSPERSDGVVFQVWVAEVRDGKRGQFQKVFEHTQKAAEWTAHSVSLARWAGKRIALKFVSDCGPADDSTTDQSRWGAVQVAGGANASMTKPVQFMTWVNERDFQSGFYFSQIASPTVDLEFSMEGVEPAWISSLTAHAHPDATFREFEHGLVVANPSPREYVFDLDDLFPGQRFRRLKATPAQDAQTNDGSTVSGPLRLQPKEGLFLVKIERK